MQLLGHGVEKATLGRRFATWSEPRVRSIHARQARLRRLLTTVAFSHVKPLIRTVEEGRLWQAAFRTRQVLSHEQALGLCSGAKGDRGEAMARWRRFSPASSCRGGTSRHE